MGVLILSLITWLVSPHAFGFWIGIPKPPVMFKSATLVTIVRDLLLPLVDSPPLWPIYAIPLVTVIAVFALVDWKAVDSKLENFLVPILCLSCLTAPYGWTFDQSLLLIAQTGLISMFYNSKLTSKQVKRYYYSLVLANLLAFIVFVLVPYEQYFFWYPMVPLLIWWHSRTITV